MKNKLLYTTATALSFATIVHAQNLLVNGSFEDLNLTTSEAGSISGNAFNYGWAADAPDFSPVGWTGTFGTDTASSLPPGTPQWITVASGNPSSFSWPNNDSLTVSGPVSGSPAEDGSIYLRLDTTAMLSQTVSTVAGQEYQLSFWVGANGDMPTAPNSLTGSVVAYVNGLSLGTFTETANLGDELDWKQYTETFTADSSSTTIGFSGAGDVDPNTFYEHNGLDNVSLTTDPTPTPEPSSVLLVGVAGVFAFFRRFSCKPSSEAPMGR
jgi:Protein of unknown function (DUF642)